jgi:hypothetical protein
VTLPPAEFSIESFVKDLPVEFPVSGNAKKAFKRFKGTLEVQFEPCRMSCRIRADHDGTTVHVTDYPTAFLRPMDPPTCQDRFQDTPTQQTSNEESPTANTRLELESEIDKGLMVTSDVTAPRPTIRGRGRLRKLRRINYHEQGLAIAERDVEALYRESSWSPLQSEDALPPIYGGLVRGVHVTNKEHATPMFSHTPPGLPKRQENVDPQSKRQSETAAGPSQPSKRKRGALAISEDPFSWATSPSIRTDDTRSETFEGSHEELRASAIRALELVRDESTPISHRLSDSLRRSQRLGVRKGQPTTPVRQGTRGLNLQMLGTPEQRRVTPQQTVAGPSTPRMSSNRTPDPRDTSEF